MPPSEFVMSIPHSAAKDEFYDLPRSMPSCFPQAARGRMQRCARSDRGSPIALSKPASGLTKTGFERSSLGWVSRTANFSRTQSTPMERVLIAFLRSKRTTIAAPKAGFRRISPAPIRTILLTGLAISTLGPENSSRAKSTRVLLQVDEEI